MASNSNTFGVAANTVSALDSLLGEFGGDDKKISTLRWNQELAEKRTRDLGAALLRRSEDFDSSIFAGNYSTEQLGLLKRMLPEPSAQELSEDDIKLYASNMPAGYKVELARNYKQSLFSQGKQAIEKLGHPGLYNILSEYETKAFDNIQIQTESNGQTRTIKELLQVGKTKYEQTTPMEQMYDARTDQFYTVPMKPTIGSGSFFSAATLAVANSGDQDETNRLFTYLNSEGHAQQAGKDIEQVSTYIEAINAPAMKAAAKNRAASRFFPVLQAPIQNEHEVKAAAINEIMEAFTNQITNFTPGNFEQYQVIQNMKGQLQSFSKQAIADFSLSFANLHTKMIDAPAVFGSASDVTGRIEPYQKAILSYWQGVEGQIDKLVKTSNKVFERNMTDVELETAKQEMMRDSAKAAYDADFATQQARDYSSLSDADKTLQFQSKRAEQRLTMEFSDLMARAWKDGGIKQTFKAVEALEQSTKDVDGNTSQQSPKFVQAVVSADQAVKQIKGLREAYSAASNLNRPKEAQLIFNRALIFYSKLKEQVAANPSFYATDTGKGVVTAIGSLKNFLVQYEIRKGGTTKDREKLIDDLSDKLNNAMLIAKESGGFVDKKDIKLSQEYNIRLDELSPTNDPGMFSNMTRWFEQQVKGISIPKTEAK